MPTSFLALKTATKANLENQTPYAAVSVRTEPQHMVVFLTLEKVLLPQDMGNPCFSEDYNCLFRFVRCRWTTLLGAVQRYWLHGLPLAVVIFITAGALTESLLLFLDFLPLLAVDGISAADMLVGTGLDHAS